MRRGEETRKYIRELLGMEEDHFLREGEVIRTEGLTKCFGDFTAVDHISFSVKEGLKVWENIRLFGGIYGLSDGVIARKTDELLQRLGLMEQRDRMVRDLPLGWKQKLAFSVAIFHEPKVVFLDEPTGGVDPATRRGFWEMIYDAAERGITVFVTTHYMDEAEYCDRVSIMVDGRIEALDSPAALKREYGATGMDEVFRMLAGRARREE